MTATRPSRARRILVRAFLLFLLSVSLVGVWACPRAGDYLVVDTAAPPVDAIVVLAGTRVERWLEAVDLYRERAAPRILLSTGQIEAAEERVRQQGIRFPRQVDLVRGAMEQLGVPADRIHVFPRAVDNTAEEAAIAREIAVREGWKRLLVVTSKYHTRRSLFAFQREFHGTGIEIQVRPTRHDASMPEEWWKHRADLRFVISELQKLLAYRLGLKG